MSEIRVGTCGWCMRQSAYYLHFNVIEIQQTFYQPPKLETAQRWREQAPEHFEFTLKAFQAITHTGSSPTFRKSRLTREQKQQAGRFRDTAVVRTAWTTTLELAQALNAGFVVFQCPAGFKPSDENLANMRRFFHWARRDRLRLGFEPRGDAWTDPIVSELCTELNLVHVVDPFIRRPVHGGVQYFRLHGDLKTYHYQYADQELAQVRTWCDAELTYCMFNNDHMRDDASRFKQMVETHA